MGMLEQAQTLQSNILLTFHGQTITIKRGIGQAQIIVYSGSAIVAPIQDSESLAGGYKVGFDACSLTLPANVSVKRGDIVETSLGTWYVAPVEQAINKSDGFGILQKTTIIRKAGNNGANANANG